MKTLRQTLESSPHLSVQPRLAAKAALCAALLASPADADTGLARQDAPVVLQPVVVEADQVHSQWHKAEGPGLEVYTNAPQNQARQFVAMCLRGLRLIPTGLVPRQAKPLQFLVVSDRAGAHGLPLSFKGRSDPRHWDERVYETGVPIVLAGEGAIFVGMNLRDGERVWRVDTALISHLYIRQIPHPPAWLKAALFGECGQLARVTGHWDSTTVWFAKLSWPDPAVAPGVYPADAADFPTFSEMFAPVRDPAAMSQEERWKFEFQAGLFARWSLFGPLKGGRDRSGFWAFAEMARCGQTTEDIFRQCYQMDWTAACAEMRRYLKSNGMGMIEVRMPQVMAEVPEAERLEFREADHADVKRILGEFRRLRESGAAVAKPTEAPR